MNLEDAPTQKDQVAQIKSQIAAFKGREAIFEEACNVTHVWVSQLMATPEYVEAVMTDMHTPGMEKLSHSPCTIGVRWELLGLAGEHWTANLPVRWQLTFDVEAVEMLKEMAAVVARRGSTVSSTLAHEVRRVRFEMRFPKIRAALQGRKGEPR